jgi:hypothetical protein
MSKLMSVLGIILLAVGAALALVGLVNPAQMQVYGLTMDTAAILLTGGILSIGLGGVIGALQNHNHVAATVVETVPVEAPAPIVAPPPVAQVEVPEPVAAVEEAPAVEEQPRVRFNPFGRKTTGAALGAAAAATAVAASTTEAVAAPAKSAVDDTIAALEQAKADIANAIGGVATIGQEKVEEVAEDAEELVEDEVVEEDLAEGELYVLEERDIRGRPARILSDNTVEAETDEGWMRFENLEHLNEYLDSMGETA